MTAFVPIAMDMYLPALPAIAQDFRADPGAAQLTLSAFFIGIALGQFLYGPASDKFGRRLPLFAGVGVFVAASIGCALAPSMEWLIVARFFQAIGASSGTVIARAIVFDRYDAREGARYLSQLMLIMGIAPILAPLLGGYFVVHGDWRAVFWFVAAFGLVIATAAFFRLTESRSAEARAFSAGESMLSACLKVLGNWPLMRVALVGAFGSASFFTYLSSAPVLLIEGFGIPADQFGYYFGVNAFGFIAAAQVNRALLARAAPEAILDRATIAVFVLALVMAAGALSGAFGMWGVLVPLFVLISAFPFVAPNAQAIAQGFDRARPGAVAAITGAVSFLAGAVLAGVSGAFYDGTARPMAIAIICTTGTALALRWVGRKPSH